MKVLLISTSEKNIRKISDIFSDDAWLRKHDLEIKGLFDTENLEPDRYDFMIIDLCGMDPEKEGDFEKKEFISLFGPPSYTGLPRMLVLEPGQAKILKEIYRISVKPDSFVFLDRLEQELPARIEFAVLRTHKPVSANSIIIGDIILDLDRYELLLNGKKIELTFKEYELLKTLLENQDKVFSRNKLLSAVWGYDFYGGSRTVDVHMRRLRSKLDLPYSNMLKTVRNVGYMFSQSK